MINFNKFKYQPTNRKEEETEISEEGLWSVNPKLDRKISNKRNRESAKITICDSDDDVASRTKTSDATSQSKKPKNDFISLDSGSEEERNTPEFTSVFDHTESMESPLLIEKKKRTFLPSNTDEDSEKLESKGKNGLGFSSSESDNDDKEITKKKFFPRLSCGISNSHVGTTESSLQKESKNMKKKLSNPGNNKRSTSSNHWEEDAPIAGKEIDENFFLDEDDIDSDSSDNDYPHLGKKRRSQIINFLQTASIDELITLESCSRKKADIIMASRPYKSWENVVMKFSSTKLLSPDLLLSCSDLLKQREILNELLEKCKAISSSLTKSIGKLRCSEDMADGISIINTPSIIPSHLQLKPYQVVGLNWLVLLHKNGVNGVLADEMGLGKTVQTISFLAHLFENDPDTGPHLIIVPSSTLGNWQREFKLWCPDIEVVLYQGSQPERRGLRVGFQRGRTTNVIITTYNCAISTPEDRAFFRKLSSEYAIFDEGHMLKNMSSQRYVNLMKIKATRKLLLTGTPLQNNLLELMSLLRFVMPQMFAQSTDSLIRIFKQSNAESGSEYTVGRIADAKKIMQPFVLRRLKKAVLKQLPAKHVETIMCQMLPDQKRIYEETKEKFRLGLNKQSSSEMKSAFTELRKAANHPLLRRNQYQTDKIIKIAKVLKRNDLTYHDSVESLIVEDMSVMTDFEIHKFCMTTPSIRNFALDKTSILCSGKFASLDTILPDIKEKGCKAVIFSQWTMIIDILEEYLNERRYKFLRLDGSTQVSSRLSLIDKFESDPSITVFLLSTKAGGLGINLTAANTVILHDIDLNPYNDKQAEDRCHRLGQTKDVRIIRLICKDSIEEGMLQLAVNKLDLEQQLTAERDDSSDIASLIQSTLTE